MRVVATIRTDELRALLRGDASDEGDPTACHRLRRLLARGSGIPLSANDERAPPTPRASACRANRPDGRPRASG